MSTGTQFIDFLARLSPSMSYYATDTADILSGNRLICSFSCVKTKALVDT